MIDSNNKIFHKNSSQFYFQYVTKIISVFDTCYQYPGISGLSLDFTVNAPLAASIIPKRVLKTR